MRFIFFLFIFFSMSSYAEDSVNNKNNPFNYHIVDPNDPACKPSKEIEHHWLMSSDPLDQKSACYNGCEWVGSIFSSALRPSGEYEVTYISKRTGASCELDNDKEEDPDKDIPKCSSDENLVFDPKTKKYSCEKKEEKCPSGYKEEHGKCVPDLKICHAKIDYNSDKETYGSASKLCQMFADNLNEATYSSRNHTLKVINVTQDSCSVGDNVYNHSLDISCDVEPPQCDTGFSLDKETNKCIKDQDDHKEGDDKEGDDQGDDKGGDDKEGDDQGDDKGGDDKEGDDQGDDKGGDDKGNGGCDPSKETCYKQDKDFCTYAKKICDFIDSFKDPKLPDDDEEPYKIEEEKEPTFDFKSKANASYISFPKKCPPDPVWNFIHGVKITFPMHIICNGLAFMKYLFIVFATIRALVIIGSI